MQLRLSEYLEEKVEMPIARAVKSVLDAELQPKEAVERLLTRQLRNENE